MITAAYLLFVLAALSLLLFGIRALQSRAFVSAEGSRKLVHVGMGLIAFPLPWCFPSAAPVWLIAAAAALALIVVRFVPGANRRFGAVLGATGRLSFGEFYFPAGIAVTFMLGHENHAAWCSAVGVLAFADTAGALAGGRFGQLKYAIRGNHKSIEGSIAVLLTALVWITLMLVFMTDQSLSSALLGATMVASAAMVIEAVSWRGLDNLLLPIVAVSLVKAWTDPSHDARLSIVAAVGLLFAIALAVAGVTGRRRLRNSRFITSSPQR
jgi:phytol kinase